MLSLGNAFDKEDLLNFEKKIINFLSLKKSAEIDLFLATRRMASLNYNIFK